MTTILIVEDELTIRIELEEKLATEGYRVLTAEGQREHTRGTRRSTATSSSSTSRYQNVRIAPH